MNFFDKGGINKAGTVTLTSSEIRPIPPKNNEHSSEALISNMINKEAPKSPVPPSGSPAPQAVKPNVSPQAPDMPQRNVGSNPSALQGASVAYKAPEQNNAAPAAGQPQGKAENVTVCTYSSGLINEVKFSDVYVTPDKKCYIWSGRTNCGLKIVTFDDVQEFLDQLEKTYDGENRSYLLNYKGRNYRVERTLALEGVQYCARKMPTSVPNLKDLGLPYRVYEHLLSLAGGSGLILLAGATGSGKSTTVSALLKEFLQKKGGYAFTIEDPIEMPLDGVYVTQEAELGLCKQTTPPDGKWEEGIKSALRSKPRYIYLGEIREPAVASEALRAATSGHLVLSTIHANNVNDAVNALVKYAASSGISEEMAYELVANGFLGCIHQILEGAPKKAKVSYLFANPDVNAACQVRGMLRSGKLNLGTILEQQRIKIERGLGLF